MPGATRTYIKVLTSSSISGRVRWRLRLQMRFEWDENKNRENRKKARRLS
jgi:hypothetical protein